MERERGKKRFLVIALAAVGLVLAVLLLDGYVLGPLNFRRATEGSWPILTWDEPHNGGGNFHYGITYTVTTEFWNVKFTSWMPVVEDRNGRCDAILKRARDGWRERWKQKRTLSLALEFLRLHGEAPPRRIERARVEANEMHSCEGWEAEVDMTTAQVEKLLGGAGAGTDSTRDLRISENEWITIQDHRAAGDPAGTRPVRVRVLRRTSKPSPLRGTGVGTKRPPP